MAPLSFIEFYVTGVGEMLVKKLVEKCVISLRSSSEAAVFQAFSGFPFLISPLSQNKPLCPIDFYAILLLHHIPSDAQTVVAVVLLLLFMLFVFNPALCLRCGGLTLPTQINRVASNLHRGSRRRPPSLSDTFSGKQIVVSGKWNKVLVESSAATSAASCVFFSPWNRDPG